MAVTLTATPGPGGSARLSSVSRSGTFAAGRAMLEAGEADQADLAATIADTMDVDIGDFGHPDLDASSLTLLLTR